MNERHASAPTARKPAARVSDTGCTGTPGVSFLTAATRRPRRRETGGSGAAAAATFADGAYDQFLRRHLRSGLNAALVGLALLATPVTAQRLVADVNPPDPRAPRVVDNFGSSPTEYVQVGDRLWFVGHARSLGWQPFISDGTEAGTRIVPGLGTTQLVAIENLDDRRVILFGEGIWVSDGTLGGTQRVATIEYARDTSTHRYRARVGNRVYFHGFTAEHGWEPWITDGTAAGTRLLRDSLPGPQPAEPYAHVLGSLRGNLFLPGLDAAAGLELWSTDGTPAGTRLVRDLNPGIADSIVPDETRFFAAEDRAFFSARVDPYGIEPCVTDGTAAGTFLLADTHRGSASGVAWSTYRPLVASGKLFFTADSATEGIEPWVSDGSTAGTFLLADLLPGLGSSHAGGFQVAGSHVVFMAANELWVSEGKRGDVRSLQRSHGERFYPAFMMTLVGVKQSSRAFFVAADVPHGRELWSTDGTIDGTRLVFDATPGPVSSRAFETIVYATGDRYVFFLDDREHGPEPWATDRTALGATMLADIWPGEGGGIDARYFASGSFRGEIVFSAIEMTHGNEPWITNGTRERTRLLADAVPTRPPSSHPQWVATLRDRALFHAFTEAHGVEPWITDGSTRGTRMLKELWPGLYPLVPARSFGAEVNDRLVFSAFEPATGMELWTSDGTSNGTRLLMDIRPGTVGSEPLPTLVAGPRLLFLASNDVRGQEPWITDGTEEGTRMLKDIAPGAASSGVRPLSLVGSPAQILFVADDRIHGAEPWITDGTPEGTKLLLDLRPGGAGSTYDVQTALLSDGSVVFSAQDSVGPGVWITDGTAAGTRLVSPAMRTSQLAFHRLESCGSSLPGRFLATELLSQRSWLSDGTAGGTIELAGGFGIASAALPDQVLVFGLGALWSLDASAQRKLVFSFSQQDVKVDAAFVTSGRLACFRATDATHGSELWVTDGTTAGTRLVLDLEPGSLGTAPAEPWIVAAGDNGRVFFNARDRAHGEEIWVSDGTAAGTRLVGDLCPGVLSSDPKPFVRVGEQWLFVAESPAVGRELFAVDLRDVGAAIARPFGAGCDGSGARAPLLGARGAPVLGTTDFTAELRHARPLAPAVLLIGRGPEPSFFAGGCSFYLQPLPADLRTVITDPLGEARVPLQVPQDPQLVGLLLHAQALVLDPHGAWLGLLAFSNGLELVIGR